MVRKIVQREQKEYRILAKNRSRIGRYSGAKRDFEREKTLTEPDMDEFRKWLVNLNLKGEEFQKKVEGQWREWTEKENGLDPDKVEIFWVGQSHLDVAWEWRIPQTIEKAFVTYEKAVFHGKNVENFCFAGSQALTFEFVRKRHPDLFKEMKEAHLKGRFELVGGSWVEPDCRMPSGEAFIRQRLYGQHYFLEHFGDMPKVEWTPDTFGYAWNMPQIIRKSGGNAFFTTKVWGNAEEYPDAPWPYTNFIWEGPDGSQILTHIQPQMFGPIRSWPITKKRSKLVKKGKTLRANYLDDRPDKNPFLSESEVDVVRDLGVFYGLGDGGHGPTGKEVAIVKKWVSEGKGHYDTVHNYFEKLADYADRLPIWNDELYFQKHQGTLTTQGMVKRGIRMLEWRTTGLEMFSTLLEMISSEYKMNYPDIKQVWLDILTNHFHDILPGSSIPEVYDDTYDHFLQDVELLDKVEHEIMKEILGEKDDVSLGQGKKIIAINTMGFARKAIVSIPISEKEGKDIFSVKMLRKEKIHRVPARFVKGDYEVEEPLMKQPDRIQFQCEFLPFEVFIGELSTERADSQIKITVEEKSDYIIVKNGVSKCIVNKRTGHISSFKWKGREILEDRSFALKAFADMAGVWEIQYDYRDWEFDWVLNSEPIIVENTVHRTVLEYKTSFEDGESVFTHQLIFYPGDPAIESKILVDWIDPQVLIKIGYSLTTKSDISIAEIPGAIISRNVNPTASHDVARWENNCQTFVDMPSEEGGWGVAFINDGKYGYSTHEGEFELTLLRQAHSPKIANEAWCKEERRQRIDAGETIMGVSDRHWHVIRQKIVPHEGTIQDAAIFEKAHGFNTPIVASNYSANDDKEYKGTESGVEKSFFVQAQTKKLIELAPRDLEILALKPREPLISRGKGGYILRIVNNSDVKVNGEINFAEELEVEFVEDVNFLEMEDTTLSEVHSNYNEDICSLQAEFKPHEIRTFLLF